MPVLICKRIAYYSPNDEFAFFDWLKRINCIKEVRGVGDEIHLVLPRRQISDSALRDLISIFERYHIDKKQLSQFLTNRNQAWFKDDPRKFWHKKVFG